MPPFGLGAEPRMPLSTAGLSPLVGVAARGLAPGPVVATAATAAQKAVPYDAAL